jgi:hypothetical protein
MPAGTTRSRASKGSPVSDVNKLNDVYRTLRKEHGVIDVKFAFVSVPAQSGVYAVVSSVLEDAVAGKLKKFTGIGDSYGLRPLPDKVKKKRRK